MWELRGPFFERRYAVFGGSSPRSPIGVDETTIMPAECTTDIQAALTSLIQCVAVSSGAGSLASAALLVFTWSVLLFVSVSAGSICLHHVAVTGFAAWKYNLSPTFSVLLYKYENGDRVCDARLRRRQVCNR